MQELADFDQLKAKVTLFVAPTSEITVSDPASNAIAQGVLKTIKEFKLMIEARRVSHTSPLTHQIRDINAYAKSIAEPLEEAEAAIKVKMVQYADIQLNARLEADRKAEEERLAIQRKADEERRKVEREARVVREAELKRLREEQEGERKRIALEEEKKLRTLMAFGLGPEEELRKAGIAAKELQAKNERDRLDKERKLEENRLAEQARIDREQADREASLREQRVVAESQRPKNTREIAKFDIVNEGMIPDEFWMVDHAKLGQAVRAGRKDISGVKIWSETVIVTR